MRNFAFIFEFYFENHTLVEFYAVLFSDEAKQRLGSSNLVAGERVAEFQEWVGDMSSHFEQKYSAFHEFSGTLSNQTFDLIGLNTNEVEDPEVARQLMEDWRQAFVDRAGSDEGISPVFVSRFTPDEQGYATYDDLNEVTQVFYPQWQSQLDKTLLETLPDAESKPPLPRL